MPFTRSQKQVLDFIQTEELFLRGFKLPRLYILKLPEEIQLEAARGFMHTPIYKTREFIKNLRQAFTLFKKISGKHYHDWKAEKIEDKFDEYLKIFLELIQKKPDREKGQIRSFPFHFQNLDLSRLLTDIGNFLVFDAKLEKFSFKQLKDFKENDDTENFWQKAQLYYANSLRFDYDEEKVVNSYVYHLKKEIAQSIFEHNDIAQPVITYTIMSALYAPLLQAVQQQAPQQYDDYLDYITRINNQVKDAAEKYHSILRSHQPKAISSSQKVLAFGGVLLLGSIFNFSGLVDSTSMLIVVIIALAVIHYAINQFNQPRQANYQAFLTQEAQENDRLYEESTRFKRIHITVVSNDAKQQVTTTQLVVPAQIKNPSLAKLLTATSTPTLTPDSQTPPPNDPPMPVAKKEHRPKRRHEKETPTESKEQSAASKTPYPQEIKFANGMTYRHNDPNCPIKPIHDGTRTLFGFFDRKKITSQLSDFSEMSFFDNVINSGVYLSKNQHGGSGVKQAGDNDFLYNSETSEYTKVTTKLRPNGIGSRVKGHRFLGQQASNGDGKVADPQRYRLDVYDTYVPLKPAHR